MLCNPKKKPRARIHPVQNKVRCNACKARQIHRTRSRPACVRCVISGKLCNISVSDGSVCGRGGVSFPEQQQPWTLMLNDLKTMHFSRALNTKLLDSFDTLPIKMVFKSKQLLSYYRQLVTIEFYSKGMELVCFPLLLQDASALRDTLLLAGTHYAIQTGDFKTYNSTILFHKIESLKLINNRLASQYTDGSVDITWRIATMCLMESVLGNYAIAETHFQGLITLFCTYQPAGIRPGTRMTVKEELAYRYLMLTTTIIHQVRSRLSENEAIMEMIRCPKYAYREEHATLLHSWISQKAVNNKSMNRLLNLITMLPSFFAQAPSTTELILVDGLPFIEYLRSLTKTLRSSGSRRDPTAPPWQWTEVLASKRLVALTNSYEELSLSDDRSTVDPSHDSSNKDSPKNPIEDPTEDLTAPYWQCTEALASNAVMTLVNSHTKSLMGNGTLSAQGFVSTWCSIAITSELYSTAVLGLSNAGRPIDRRLLRILISILIRDLNPHEDLSVISNPSDFWLWKYFISAYSLAWHQHHEFDDTLCEAQDFFDRSILAWSKARDIRQWEHAQRRLSKITWPDDQPQTLAKEVWAKAIGKPQRASKPKVRSGCVTCKIRHVKCDELKPTCQRCKTAGITCEGYKEVRSCKKPKVNTTRALATLVPLLPRPEPLF